MSKVRSLSDGQQRGKHRISSVIKSQAPVVNLCSSDDECSCVEDCQCCSSSEESDSTVILSSSDCETSTQDKNNFHKYSTNYSIMPQSEKTLLDTIAPGKNLSQPSEAPKSDSVLFSQSIDLTHLDNKLLMQHSTNKLEHNDCTNNLPADHDDSSIALQFDEAKNLSVNNPNKVINSVNHYSSKSICGEAAHCPSMCKNELQKKTKYHVINSNQCVTKCYTGPRPIVNPRRTYSKLDQTTLGECERRTLKGSNLKADSTFVKFSTYLRPVRHESELLCDKMKVFGESEVNLYRSSQNQVNNRENHTLPMDVSSGSEDGTGSLNILKYFEFDTKPFTSNEIINNADENLEEAGNELVDNKAREKVEHLDANESSNSFFQQVRSKDDYDLVKNMRVNQGNKIGPGSPKLLGCNYSYSSDTNDKNIVKETALGSQYEIRQSNFNFGNLSLSKETEGNSYCTSRPEGGHGYVSVGSEHSTNVVQNESSNSHLPCSESCALTSKMSPRDEPLNKIMQCEKHECVSEVHQDAERIEFKAEPDFNPEVDLMPELEVKPNLDILPDPDNDGVIIYCRNHVVIFSPANVRSDGFTVTHVYEQEGKFCRSRNCIHAGELVATDSSETVINTLVNDNLPDIECECLQEFRVPDDDRRSSKCLTAQQVYDEEDSGLLKIKVECEPEQSDCVLHDRGFECYCDRGLRIRPFSWSKIRFRKRVDNSNDVGVENAASEVQSDSTGKLNNFQFHTDKDKINMSYRNEGADNKPDDFYLRYKNVPKSVCKYSSIASSQTLADISSHYHNNRTDVFEKDLFQTHLSNIKINGEKMHKGSDPIAQTGSVASNDELASGNYARDEELVLLSSDCLSFYRLPVAVLTGDSPLSKYRYQLFEFSLKFPQPFGCNSVQWQRVLRRLRRLPYVLVVEANEQREQLVIIMQELLSRSTFDTEDCKLDGNLNAKRKTNTYYSMVSKCANNTNVNLNNAKNSRCDSAELKAMNAADCAEAAVSSKEHGNEYLLLNSCALDMTSCKNWTLSNISAKHLCANHGESENLNDGKIWSSPSRKKDLHSLSSLIVSNAEVSSDRVCCESKNSADDLALWTEKDFSFSALDNINEVSSLKSAVQAEELNSDCEKCIVQEKIFRKMDHSYIQNSYSKSSHGLHPYCCIDKNSMNNDVTDTNLTVDSKTQIHENLSSPVKSVNIRKYFSKVIKLLKGMNVSVTLIDSYRVQLKKIGCSDEQLGFTNVTQHFTSCLRPFCNSVCSKDLQSQFKDLTKGENCSAGEGCILQSRCCGYKLETHDTRDDTDCVFCLCDCSDCLDERYIEDPGEDVKCYCEISFEDCFISDYTTLRTLKNRFLYGQLKSEGFHQKIRSNLAKRESKIKFCFNQHICLDIEKGRKLLQTLEKTKFNKTCESSRCIFKKKNLFSTLSLLDSLPLWWCSRGHRICVKGDDNARLFLSGNTINVTPTRSSCHKASLTPHNSTKKCQMKSTNVPKCLAIGKHFNKRQQTNRRKCFLRKQSKVLLTSAEAGQLVKNKKNCTLITLPDKMLNNNENGYVKSANKNNSLKKNRDNVKPQAAEENKDLKNKCAKNTTIEGISNFKSVADVNESPDIDSDSAGSVVLLQSKIGDTTQLAVKKKVSFSGTDDESHPLLKQSRYLSVREKAVMKKSILKGHKQTQLKMQNTTKKNSLISSRKNRLFKVRPLLKQSRNEKVRSSVKLPGASKNCKLLKNVNKAKKGEDRRLYRKARLKKVSLESVRSTTSDRVVNGMRSSSSQSVDKRVSSLYKGLNACIVKLKNLNIVKYPVKVLSVNENPSSITDSRTDKICLYQTNFNDSSDKENESTKVTTNASNNISTEKTAIITEGNKNRDDALKLSSLRSFHRQLRILSTQPDTEAVLNSSGVSEEEVSNHSANDSDYVPDLPISASLRNKLQNSKKTQCTKIKRQRPIAKSIELANNLMDEIKEMINHDDSSTSCGENINCAPNSFADFYYKFVDDNLNGQGMETKSETCENKPQNICEFNCDPLDISVNCSSNKTSENNPGVSEASNVDISNCINDKENLSSENTEEVLIPATTAEEPSTLIDPLALDGKHYVFTIDDSDDDCPDAERKTCFNTKTDPQNGSELLEESCNNAENKKQQSKLEERNNCASIANNTETSNTEKVCGRCKNLGKKRYSTNTQHVKNKYDALTQRSKDTYSAHTLRSKAGDDRCNKEILKLPTAKRREVCYKNVLENCVNKISLGNKKRRLSATDNLLLDAKEFYSQTNNCRKMFKLNSESICSEAVEKMLKLNEVKRKRSCREALDDPKLFQNPRVVLQRLMTYPSKRKVKEIVYY